MAASTTTTTAFNVTGNTATATTATNHKNVSEPGLIHNKFTTCQKFHILVINST